MNGWRYLLFILAFPVIVILLLWALAWGATRFMKGPTIAELPQNEDGERLERDLEKPHDDERD